MSHTLATTIPQPSYEIDQSHFAAELQLAADTLVRSGHLGYLHDARGLVTNLEALNPAFAVSARAAAVAAWVDPTERHLRVLDPVVQRAAFQLVRTARLAGLPVWISSSIRTAAHQSELRQAGRSQTLNSLHVRPAGQVRAFDIDLKGYHRDRVPARVWNYLGPLGESLGLRWGGRWTSLRDLGHFEGIGGFHSGPGF